MLRNARPVRPVRPVKETLGREKKALNDMSKELLAVVRDNVYSLNRKYNSTLYEPGDFVQDICIKLISNDCQLLKQYDPARGKSPSGYIKMISEREMLNVIRKEKAEKRGRDLTVRIQDSIEPLFPEPLDTKVEARNFALRLYLWLCEKLSDLGISVLHAIYFQDVDVADAAARLGMTPQAIYNWQHRIRALSREFASINKSTSGRGKE